jgi:SynChlorMet cassette radical SAM/SPASM protein ScmE
MSDLKVILTPRSVSISITGRCNLQCKYCFYANEMTALKDLPTDRWLSLFDDLGRLGVMDVCLTGGEAFTRPDLFVLIDGIIGNRMRYSILSNGTLIDEKVLAQLDKGKRLRRLDSIQISIDGSNPEVHDQSRPNSFTRAMRGLRLLKENGYPVTVRVTINRHNLHDLKNITHLLLEEIGLSSFSTNEAMPIGSGCHNAGEVSLTAEDQRQTMEIIGRLQERYKGRLQAQAGPQAKRKMYAEMEHSRKTGEKSKSWTMGYLTACGCVLSRIDILHNGDIVPCCMLPELVLGNITTDSIAEIWRTHPIMEALRLRREISMVKVVGCEGCEWTEYCNGSCPGLAHQLTGDFNQANPEDCYRRFLLETEDMYALR